jgi:hypothetical protein
MTTQLAGPPHPSGSRMQMRALLHVGVPYEYLEKMLKVTSAEVLGLEPGWTPKVPDTGSEHLAGSERPKMIHGADA